MWSIVGSVVLASEVRKTLGVSSAKKLYRPIGTRPQCGQPSVNLRKSIHKSEKHIRKNLKQHQAGAQLT